MLEINHSIYLVNHNGQILFLINAYPFQMKFHVTVTTPVNVEEPVVELWWTTNVPVLKATQELTVKVS